jgi:hypothetical protein
MNTDDTDFGKAGGEDGGGSVEFVAVPGGYGFERVRLRIEPPPHQAKTPGLPGTPSLNWEGARRPAQPEIPPEDAVQVHAVLG